MIGTCLLYSVYENMLVYALIIASHWKKNPNLTTLFIMMITTRSHEIFQ